MYQIVITKPAENDMKEAAKYIADQLLNPAAVKRLLDDAERVIYSLSEMPQRHALASDDALSRSGIRFVPVNNYLVFYVVREEKKTVVIQRFLYGKRDWINILSSENS